ncbi:MAG: hypothetical protein UV73_C0015G0023 [Candidatus Gottesmanbacteria bacterium GW2011_GWA2_43_14]|uniref:Uncharacterized protein n=1 Tax=Candidatus Gottesmanbacteria bacterium GW2011_GWA2_43_14 TaxID=1618443 RepID=A0A0G1G9N2_9BACT|nr:MAG: hypothetical protein UV73_C0015G0023 [Candidatus Gottesmanbacteria bacterium GW2011_GWA2_43_14]
MLYLKSAKITAPSDNERWGGCLAEDGLFVLLEVATDGKVLASHIGKAALDQLILAFQTSQKDHRLEIRDLLDEFQGNPYIKVLIVGFLENNRLSVGCHGEGVAVLVREGKSGRILTAQGISRGVVKSGDRIIFHSESFIRNWQGNLQDKIYSLKNLTEFEEVLSPELSGNQSFAGSAVLIAEVKHQDAANSPVEGVISLKQEAGKFRFLTYWQHRIRNFNIARLQDFLPANRKRRSAFLVITVLVLLLLGNIAFGVARMKQASRSKEVREALASVEQQYTEAQGILDLNPVRARELLSSSKLTLGSLLKNSKRNSPDQKLVNDWLNKVSASEVAAYRIFKLTQVPVFFDTTLIKAGGEADNLSAYQEKKAILDKSNKTLYFLSTETKEAAVVAGADNLKTVSSLAIHGSNAYFLNEEGIFSVDLGSKKVSKVIEKSDRWGEIVDMEAFGGNLYLLDVKNNSIWKYIAAESGFSSIISYINSGVQADLSQAKELAIDGSIWVANAADIFKFTAGAQELFAFKGISDSISTIDGIATSDEDENLYILDKTLSRILVFDKDGLYQSQYQWEELKNAEDIIASEAEGMIFVLLGSKIHAIEIQ